MSPRILFALVTFKILFAIPKPGYQSFLRAFTHLCLSLVRRVDAAKTIAIIIALISVSVTMF